MDHAYIRAVVSFAVLGAGLIIIASSLPPPSSNPKRSLGPVTSIAKGQPQEAQPVARAQVLRSFAPEGRWFDVAPVEEEKELAVTEASTSVLRPTPVSVGADPATGIIPAGQPNQTDRRELARALQLELKRVHCYDGFVDGEWLLQSKLAMKAFLDRVNASLPIDKPDHVLLALVKAHSTVVCGQACPAGQSLAANGHCLPTTPTVTAGSANNIPMAAYSDRPSVTGNDNGSGDVTSPMAGAMMAGAPRTEPPQQSTVSPVQTPTVNDLFIHPLGQ